MRNSVRLTAALISVILGLGSASFNSAEAKPTLDLSKASDKQVSFVAIGKPSFLKIEGKGDALSGSLSRDGNGVSGTAEFKLESLDTGIELRNHHMKEKYLQIEQYPKATLSIKTLPWGPEGSSDFSSVEGPFAGDLTLHGVTKAVAGTAKMTKAGMLLTAHVEFKTELSAYKMDVPSFKGITVADSVEITIDVQGTLTP